MNMHIKRMVTAAAIACSVGLLLPGSNTRSTASGTHHQLTTSQKIDRRIKHMTLNEKIGQLFVSAVSNNRTTTKANIKKYHLGGIILMGNNYVGTKSSFTHRLKNW